MATQPAPDPRADLSRDRIMQALAEVTAEKGVAGFSVQEIADRAGVSHRTVYRHYESRQGLLDAYARMLDEKLIARGGVASPPRADDLPDTTRRVFGLFDELGSLIEALVVVSLGTRTRVARRRERSVEFARILQEAGLTDHLPPDEAEAVTALVRTLSSSNTWFLFRHEYDIDGDRAGRVVSWALETLLRELRAGGGPQPRKERPSDREEEAS